MESVADRVARFKERVDTLAQRYGRNSEEIVIVGVAKTFPAAVIDEGIEAGLEDIGENRVQELLQKKQEVEGSCRWHLVGHLQTNKVTKIAGEVALIHSVDSVRLAEALDTGCEKKGIRSEVLIQVNTTGEESKFGVPPEEAVEAAAQVASLRNLELTGLMTIGPFTDVRGEMVRSFALLRLLRDRYNDHVDAGARLKHLSMGMSADYEMAIAEGSTILRVGTVLFGSRD